MATATTQWILELQDKLTAPLKSIMDNAKKAAEGVDNINDNLKKIKPIDIQAVSQSVGQLRDDFNSLMQPGIDFDAQLKDLSALTGVTGDKLDDLGLKARETGKAFGVDASGMVESYKGVLSRLGPDIAKNGEALQLMGVNIATLSKTMKGDSVGAMDALTTSMLQFGINLDNPMQAAKDMGLMMNIMAAGAKEGAAEVPDISAALKNAGVEALNAHVSFGEVNASLQALAQGGKVGADAGVALRNVLTRMQGIDIVPKRAREKLKELGVDYGVVSNKMLPFTTRLRELSKAQKDSTLISEIFGVENSAAANILMRSTKYQDDMKNKILGTNTATVQANTVMSSYKETMAKVTAWIKDLGISFFSVGKYIAPFVTGIAGAVIVLANLANARMGIQMLFGMLKTMPTISAMVTGGFGWMAASARAFGTAIMNIPVIGWILAVIAALIALGTYFYKTSATFRGFLWGVWEATKTVFTGMGAFVGSVLNGILHLLQGVFNPANWFNKNYKFSDGLKQITDAATNYGKQIGESFQKGKAAGMGDFAAEKTAQKAGQTQTSNGKAGALDINNVTPTLNSKSLGKTKNSEKAMGSNGGGAKIQSITQKIEMKNYFTIAKDAAQGEIDAMAEKVVSAINGRLRDGMVAAAN
jgi:TP901 family phage tail tape measure protein